MLSHTDEESPRQQLRCHWPQLFTERRNFSRQAENEPYIEWLKASFDNSERYSNESDYLSDGEDLSSESNYEEDEEDKERGDCSPETDVRLFMNGMVGDSLMQYRDQVDLVAKFCEQAKFKRVKTDKAVALLDERSNSGDVFGNRGRCRPYLGPLTAQQLKTELSKKVFHFAMYKITRKFTFQSGLR
jgi:hypothetical protein